MKKLPIFLTALSILTSTVSLIGCSKTVKPGDVRGYDEGEQYISMWVHTIEDTPEGEAYKKSVERFNEKYDGTYFADIEFIPRNDSGGGYSDKINASVGGDLVSEDGLTADGYFNSDKNAAVFQYFRGLVENKYMSATPYEISKPGDTIDFTFVPSRMHFFDTQTEESLF